jgi:hypothetical protein
MLRPTPGSLVILSSFPCFRCRFPGSSNGICRTCIGLLRHPFVYAAKACSDVCKAAVASRFFTSYPRSKQHTAWLAGAVLAADRVLQTLLIRNKGALDGVLGSCERGHQLPAMC